MPRNHSPDPSWNYCETFPDLQDGVVSCTLCKALVSLGPNKRNRSIGNFKNHIKNKHLSLWTELYGAEKVEESPGSRKRVMEESDDELPQAARTIKAGKVHFQATLDQGQPYYLDFKSMEIYRDIELVSMEREVITLNKCVFAGLSRSCHQMLTSVSMEDSTKIVIVTEHTKEHLNKVANFATTGKLYGYLDQLQLARDEGTVKAFADFGVDVLNLSLSPVPLKNDEVEYKQNQWSFKPRTNPTVIKNECEDTLTEIKLESEISEIDYDHSSYEEPIFEETVDKLGSNEDEMLSVALKKKTGKKRKSLDKKLKSDSDPDYEPASKKANVSSKDDEQKSDPNPPNKTGAKKWKNYHYEFHNISMIKDPQLRGQKWGILRDDDTSSKFQRKNEAFFFFPQDEKLRDPINFPFQCMMCVRGFKNKKNFNQHVK